MSVTRIELTNVHALDEVYRQLATQIELPAHFGNNLDALFDLLTTDIRGPLQIVWHCHDASATRLGHDNYTALLAVLHDAAHNRPDLDLILD